MDGSFSPPDLSAARDELLGLPAGSLLQLPDQAWVIANPHGTTLVIGGNVANQPKPSHASGCVALKLSNNEADLHARLRLAIFHKSGPMAALVFAARETCRLPTNQQTPLAAVVTQAMADQARFLTTRNARFFVGWGPHPDNPAALPIPIRNEQGEIVRVPLASLLA